MYQSKAISLLSPQAALSKSAILWPQLAIVANGLACFVFLGNYSSLHFISTHLPLIIASAGQAGRLPAFFWWFVHTHKLLVFHSKLTGDQHVRQAAASSAFTDLRSVTICTLYGSIASLSK